MSSSPSAVLLLPRILISVRPSILRVRSGFEEFESLEKHRVHTFISGSGTPARRSSPSPTSKILDFLRSYIQQLVSSQLLPFSFLLLFLFLLLQTLASLFFSLFLFTIPPSTSNGSYPSSSYQFSSNQVPQGSNTITDPQSNSHSSQFNSNFHPSQRGGSHPLPHHSSNQEENPGSDSDSCSTCSTCSTCVSEDRNQSLQQQQDQVAPSQTQLPILSLSSLPHARTSSQPSLSSHPPNQYSTRFSSISPSGLINSSNFNLLDYDLGPPPFFTNHQSPSGPSFHSVSSSSGSPRQARPEGPNQIYYYSHFQSPHEREEQHQGSDDMASFSLNSAASGGIVSILENNSPGPSFLRRASLVNNSKPSSSAGELNGDGQRRGSGGGNSGSASNHSTEGEESGGGTGSDFFGSGNTGGSNSATSLEPSSESGSGSGIENGSRKRSASGQLIHEPHHLASTHARLESGARVPQDQPQTREDAESYAHGHSNPRGLEGQQLLQDDRKFVSSPLPQDGSITTPVPPNFYEKPGQFDPEDPNRRKRRDSSPREDYRHEGGWQSSRQGHAPAYPDHQEDEAASPQSQTGKGAGRGKQQVAAQPKSRDEIVPLQRSASASSKAKAPLPRPIPPLSESPGSAKGRKAKPITLPDGKKRYPCQHPGCDKTFSTSGHSARHNRIHTGELRNRFENGDMYITFNLLRQS